MKVLIAYRSRYGVTESCAKTLAGRISSGAVLHDLRSSERQSLEGFDIVLIGGSIYGGRIQREIPAFCDRERESLLSRKVGLFICCFYTGERAAAEIQEAFPSWLTAHAFAREVLGGELSLSKLSFLDRILVRTLVRPARNLFMIRTDAIEELAAAVNALQSG
ncbi:MAG TPA: flavodoxin domain-containing protein [Spirochaetia bacterium]|nr:flavodoxin domain-containing protein [Spirochaetia bacterium]